MTGEVNKLIKGLVTNKKFMSCFIISIIYSLMATFICWFIFNHLPDKYREM